MTPDPIESPLATRARTSEATGMVPGSAGGSVTGAERAIMGALDRPPLQREWLALEAWFQALDAVDQAAVAVALGRKVQPEFVPILKANAGQDPFYNHPMGSIPSSLAPQAAGPEGDHPMSASAATTAATSAHGAPGAAVAKSSGSSGHAGSLAAGSSNSRTERFENFVDLARPGRQATAPPDASAAASAAAAASDPAGAGSSQNRFRTFRSLGASQTPSAGASPFVNSFISPVPKSGLYSQAFAPLGQRQQPFTPWSLSQEINRPKSATELNPSGSPTYSPYQSHHPWGQTPAPQSYPSGGLDLMRGGQPGGESKLQPVSKRWTASPLRPKTGPAGATSSGPASAGANAAGQPGSPAPGTSSLDISPSSASIGLAAGPIGPINPTPGPGLDTPGGKRREDKVWNSKPFQPHYASAVASPSLAPAAVSPPSAPAALGDTVVVASVSSTSLTEGPSSPRAANQSPYAKRSVNYMDIELLTDMGAWLRSLRLHKYTENLSDIPWQEIVLLNDADLEARGVNALGARRKMLKMFEEIRAAQDTGKLPK